MEFGIFNDEGLVEGGFVDRDTAETTVREMYSDEDDLHVGEICHDHPDYEAANCEACAADEAEETDDEDFESDDDDL